jgi:hypothetical protein
MDHFKKTLYKHKVDEGNWKKKSEAGLSLQRLGFDPEPVVVRFLVEEVTLYFGISVFPSQCHHLKTTRIRQRRGRSLGTVKHSIFRCILSFG